MNIPLLVKYFLVLFGYDFNKKARLEKQEPKSKYDTFFNKIAPYIIFFGGLLIVILLFIILIKYGQSITGTEANHYYNGGLA